MRRILCIGIMGLLPIMLAAQEADIVRAALYLSGASTEEELDTSLLEMLEARMGRPLPINSSHLRPDGILTDYQTASLADYRARHGGILSWEELALVDGFNQDAVQALKPFLSLYSSGRAGVVDSVRVKGEILLRATLKNVGVKGRASGNGWRAGAVWRGTDWTAYGEWISRRHRILLGHYNLRFGQGLGLWTGFSMESLSTVDAFMKRGYGASPVWSYNSADIPLGAVYECAFGRVKAMAFGSVKGLAGVRAQALFLRGSAGGTLWWTPGSWNASLDGKYNWRRADIAAELAYKNRSVGGMLSARMRPVDGWTASAQLRLIPSRFSGKKNGEYAVALGGAYSGERRVTLAGKTGFGSSVQAHRLSLTMDAALLPQPGKDARRLQVRAWAQWLWQIHPAWALELRATERYRNYERPRTDLRASLRFGNGPWSGTGRLEWAHCRQIGFLVYGEGGYKNEFLQGYLRISGFLIDQWDDRIYCYEREAPGNFSVPAYYGRGGTVSLMTGYRHRFGRICTLKTYLRASWMARAAREPTWALSLQLQLAL